MSYSASYWTLWSEELLDIMDDPLLQTSYGRPKSYSSYNAFSKLIPFI
ncbi:hypothetical protein TNCT_401001, partial [Trichonephila clavata]